jgi:phosphoesterase RecJ-like protein
MQIDNTLQQITDLLSGGSIKKLLITSGKNVDPDAVGSMLAMAAALQGTVESVQLAVEEFDASPYRFLPGAESIGNTVGHKSLVVSFDVGSSPIEKINYNAQGTKFNLILTPKAGQVDVEQIEYSYTGVDFDAIIAVDTAKKELLGRWVEDFAEELKDIPLINIDHHPDNERFGTFNFVQAEKPAAVMVVHQIIQALDIPVTQPIATYLLAGLLSDTGGFANSNADAASLRFAADMVEAGAPIHQLMQALFRTMNVEAMHLWGAVLSAVTVEDPGIVITQLDLGQIAQQNAAEADIDTLGTLVNNILVSDRRYKVAVMLKEKENGEVSGSIRSIDADVDVSAIARRLGGGGHVRAAGFRLKQVTVEQARRQFLESARQELATTVKTDISEGNEEGQADQ